jgi:hypothetical protein
MGRPNIAETGKRFTSEYQPAGRGRPKGSLNKRTVLQHYLRDECEATERVINQICVIVFGPQRARKMRKRSIKNLQEFFGT